MDYHFLAYGRWPADGEVQIFDNYRDRLFASVQARREVIERGNYPDDEEALEEVISQRRRQILKRRTRRPPQTSA
jgi:hypothetical protein